MEKKVKVGIGVMILKDNRVLLGKRYGDSEENTAKGTWTFPGGKLQFGENIDSSGKREVLEETGMGVGDLELISVTNDISYGNHFITIGFLTNNFEGEPKVMEPNKITEWRWFSLNELPEPMFLPSLKLINNYLKNKIYKGD